MMVMRRGLQTLAKSPAFMYENNVGFRKKANSRISILKKIVPEEYLMDDYILFNCLYFSPDNTVKMRHIDPMFGSIKVPQTKVVNLGSKYLHNRVSSFVMADLSKNNSDKLDLLEQVRRTAFVMDSARLRTLFINQFLHQFDIDGQLDQEASGRDTRAIKIDQSVRLKVLPALVGFMRTELPSGQCDLFIDEFVLKGRGSEKYTHKGLEELYRDRITRIY